MERVADQLEFDYDDTLNLAKYTTNNRLFLIILFSFLTVVGSGSVACGDSPVAPRGSVGDYNLTDTVANHLDDVVKKAGPYQGKQARSFMNSPHLLDEIMAGGKAVPDKFVDGALRWDVPGTFRGSSGTWELVLDPKTKTILHWNFVK